jgi:hypothetical protein
MAEISERVIDYENDPAAIAKMRAQFKLARKDTPKERKQREQKIRSAVDGRSLRATGRTVQFNFKCWAETGQRAREAAKAKGMTIAEWMQRAVDLALAQEQGGSL